MINVDKIEKKIKMVEIIIYKNSYYYKSIKQFNTQKTKIYLKILLILNYKLINNYYFKKLFFRAFLLAKLSIT